jgi:hypothetical protein
MGDAPTWTGVLRRSHWTWLGKHPDRSEQWLRERIADGFQIHHVDGNHENDHPNNLVLIEGNDHLRLQGREFKNLTDLAKEPLIGPKIGISRLTAAEKMRRHRAKKRAQQAAQERLCRGLPIAQTALIQER